MHLQPAEILIPDSLSLQTTRLLTSYLSTREALNDPVRVERHPLRPFFISPAATARVESCLSALSLQTDRKGSDVFAVISASIGLRSCLSALTGHLSEFGFLSQLEISGNYRRFSDDRYLSLPGSTMRNLEVLANLDSGASRGSLLWLINRTTTNSGALMLRRWLAQPLIDPAAITARQDAISILTASVPPFLQRLKDGLVNLFDIDSFLQKVHFRLCTPAEFVKYTEALLRCVLHFHPSSSRHPHSSISNCLTLFSI